MTHALITANAEWSQADAEAAIALRIADLQEQGIREGSVVCVPAVPNEATVWTIHALFRIGAVAMPTPLEPTAHQQSIIDAHRMEPATSDTRLRLMTSGTTGQPKRIDLTRNQIEASAIASMERLDHNAQDRWICCLPLHHIGGLSILYRSARAGSCVDLQPRFDAAAVNASIDAGATIVSVVPTMLQRILDHRNDWPFPAHLRVILMGGAPASKALLDRCRAINAPVSLTWGMTETASQIATRAPGDLRQEPDSGHPLSGTSVHVEDGHLVVEGPIAPGGRLVTADRGHIDPQGRIVVTGRGHDLIISGGENIDPVRVEQALCSHEDVDAAAVVGRPDAEWGQRPVAFVTGRPSDTLEARMQSMLPAHERPAEIHWVDSLPRTELGKLKRSDLVDQANALHRLSKD